MAEQQVLKMTRPAAYWARRAAFHHRRGNRHQAETLYQHAVTLTPDNIAFKLAYARVLQEMHRYEASNRQAFAALAQDPACPSCLGLIGQNLMALGFLEEAADAFAQELVSDSTAMAEAHAEHLDRLELLLNNPDEPSVRYCILVQRAAEFLSSGAWEQAKRTLERACAMPRKDERCHTLMSLYHRATGSMEQAIEQATAACSLAPRSARTFCSLAELYCADHQRGQALKALLRAAARVLTAQDERLLCQTAIHLGFPTAPLPTLEHLGSRVHTLYNKSVLLLKAGQAQRAMRVLDQCRALDPDDVPTRFLRRTAQALIMFPREQAAEHAEGIRLYPALSDVSSEDCYRTFMQALADGTEAFAWRLQTDPTLYRLTLYQAENPYIDISGLLEQVIPYLKENFTLKMLREILTLPMGGYAEKQLAVQLLMHYNAQPFVLWHDGRLSFIKPHGSNETSEEMRLKDHLLYRRSTGRDPRLMTHTLRLIRHMPLRMRLKIAAAHENAFMTAVQMHYALTHPAASAPQTIPHLHHVLRMYNMLRRMAPASSTANQPPQLWLAKGREETHEIDRF